MSINLDKLNYTFKKKPLLVGGKAMEYYDLRTSGNDIDLIADELDVKDLIKMYPDRVKDLWGDLGVCPMEFEIWRTICLFSYEDLVDGAIDIGDVLVVSKEKLLFMKALAMKKEKYFKDSMLLVESILKDQFANYEIEAKQNKQLLEGINKISYIEKLGPEN